MRTFLLVVGLTALVATLALAQGESDYQGWMKTNASTMASLQKNITAKDGGLVASDAQKLEGIFKQVEAFWQGRNTADAVNFAKQAQAAAAAISRTAAAGNLDQAGTEVKNLQGTCGGCHMAHRERTPEGAFKIK